MSAKRYLGVLPVVLLVGACGGPTSTIETKSATVAPLPSASTSAGPAASTNDDAYLADLPPMAAPKPLTPANVFAIDLKVPVAAQGIASKNLPIVYLRVVVRAGNAAGVLMGTGAKAKTGIADLTAELLKDGGAGRFSPTQLADFVDGLGTDLTVETGPDRVIFGIAVTKDKLDAALEVLSAVVLHPRFDGKEFDKLKARELDRVRQAEKSDGFWLARNALYRELFGPGHPYAEVDANEQTLANVTLADVREFYKKLYVAENTMVFVAGDVTAAEIAPKLDAALKGISTAAAPKIDYPKPAAATGRHVILATKAGAKQADVFVGMLGLERKDDHWPDLALALQALGGGMSARLFRDVREKRSLAYSTSASARELAHGPSMIALYAGTQTPSAPQSVVALLENLGWLTGERPVSEGELGIARVSQETSFVYRLETIGQVASLAIDKAVLGLPGKDVYDYVASYRKTLHDATLADVNHVAFDVLKAPGVVIAVAGDASLAKPLSHFATVHVVDPEKGFVTTAQLPFDANASLDVPANPPAK